MLYNVVLLDEVWWTTFLNEQVGFSSIKFFTSWTTSYVLMILSLFLYLFCIQPCFSKGSRTVLKWTSCIVLLFRWCWTKCSANCRRRKYSCKLQNNPYFSLSMNIVLGAETLKIMHYVKFPFPTYKMTYQTYKYINLKRP